MGFFLINLQNLFYYLYKIFHGQKTLNARRDSPSLNFTAIVIIFQLR